MAKVHPLRRKLENQSREEAYKKIVDAWKRVDEGWKIYEPLPQTKEEEKLWKEFVPAWNAWKTDHETYVKMAKEWDAKRLAKEDAKALESMHDKLVEQALVINPKTFGKAESLLNKICDINEQVATHRPLARHQGQLPLGVFMELTSLTSPTFNYTL